MAILELTTAPLRKMSAEIHRCTYKGGKLHYDIASQTWKVLSKLISPDLYSSVSFFGYNTETDMFCLGLDLYTSPPSVNEYDPSIYRSAYTANLIWFKLDDSSHITESKLEAFGTSPFFLTSRSDTMDVGDIIEPDEPLIDWAPCDQLFRANPGVIEILDYIKFAHRLP